MSILREGIKHLLKEAVPPLPGFSILAQACDSGSSGVSHKEAAITQHVEDLKRSLDRLNAVDHTREVEFKGQLDRLMDDYRRSNTDINRLSRLAKVTETLEALDNLSEQITRSIQGYTVDSISDHSETLKSVDDDLKSAKADVEKRMTKNEAKISSVFDMLKNLKELLHQAGENLASLRPPSLAQFWTVSNSSGDIEEDLVGCLYFTDNKYCSHPWGLAFHEYSRNGHASDSIDFLASHFPECYNSAVRGGHYCPGDNINHTSAPPGVPSAPRDQGYRLHKRASWSQSRYLPGLNIPTWGYTGSLINQGCTTPRSFDISSMFSHQASATQVIAECFRNMASSIRIDPHMPIHTWSHSCEPMAST